ncbi:MAG: TonB-dependent receptor plug domain-containing protein [Bacillota bacterium]
MNSNQIGKAVRYALAAGAVTALSAPAAFAADATTTTDQNASNANQTSTAQLGKIEVTGTRIKRTDVETAQPVTIITAAQLKQTGLTSIGDILQTVTQAGASLNTTFNNGGNGRTNIDLRFLGPQRVLVLVNGRRWITGLGGPGQQGVDLNQIPVSVIDHVEILQDGASAIYGSDAIAGVVNIITVKNYNGAEANAYTSIYSGEGHHDGKVQEYDFTIGSAGDKAGVTMNVTYVNQHEVWAGARDISKEPVWGQNTTVGSSASPSGRFITVPTASTGDTKCFGTATINPTYGTCDMTLINSPKPGFAGSPTGPSAANFRDFAPADHYNFAPLNYFVTPNERTSLYTQAHYDISDNLTFSTEVVFNKRNSQQALASSPLFLGLAGASTANGQPIGVGKTNPYNPFGVTLNGNLSTWNPATQDLLVFLGRRPIEAGQRLFSENVETFQFASGFKGYFNVGGNEWDWDLSYGYGNNIESDLTTGLFNTERLAIALDSPGVSSCASQPGCVPFNIFGGAGSITQPMLNYVLYEDHSLVEATQRDYTGNLNGSLADLPAGPLGFALGYEYLQQDGLSHPDATTSSGNSSGNVTQPTDGRTKTNAEYVEFDFPLVADAPGFKMLDLDIANRWSQFKWYGGIPGTTASTILHTANATTGRAALKWQPSDSLLVRASWSQGFRAPNISELFFGASDAFPTVFDPCAKGPNGSWDGVPADLPPGCGTAHTQPNGQIKSTVGGNANLTPERSISKTIGFVWNPDFIPGFDFSMDYYHIDLENAITATPPQVILNSCYGANGAKIDPSECKYIAVAGGIITDIVDLNRNIGGFKTNGIDVATHYKLPSTSIGDFKISLDWTFLKYVDQILTSSVSSELAGTTTLFGGFPKQRANIGLNWNYGDWSAMWNAEYIHSMEEGCSHNTLFGDKGAFLGSCSNPGPLSPNGKQYKYAYNYLGNTIYHDVQATYHQDSINTDFTFGIRNLFDKQPPAALTAFANSFLPAFYRVPGREFYGRISVKF